MKTHHFIAKSQYQSYLDMKENLSPSEVIAVGDFSENYSIPNQREIQSAYYSHKAMTIPGSSTTERMKRSSTSPL